ncbi:MAG: hypothetical protein RIC19_00110 [Phaeodactylibacter sp.]|uniref:anti-sigma factor family protein n=1 Tax=Phaeodactylibacter sp. TaxID=1940289 RepID=UPI0032ED2C6D
MAIPEENSRRIQDYLDGEMSDADRHRFEQDCAKDKSLAADLALYQSVQQALRDEEALVAFRRKVTDRIAQHQSLKVDSAKAGRAGGRNLLLFLIALAIMGGALFLFRRSGSSSIPQAIDQPDTPSPSSLANSVDSTSTSIVKADDIAAPPSDPREASAPLQKETSPSAQEKPRGRKAEASAYRQLALSEFTTTTFVFRGITTDNGSGDSSEYALLLFAQAGATTDVTAQQSYLERVVEALKGSRVAEDPRLLLTRAQAYFQLGQYAKAASDFKALRNSFIYGGDADWGLALCYLAQMPAKADAFQDAMSVLLMDESHSFHAKAVQLSKQVEAIEE